MGMKMISIREQLQDILGKYNADMVVIPLLIGWLDDHVKNCTYYNCSESTMKHLIEDINTSHKKGFE
jgi:chromatin remodeling complex protein RSC6